MKQTVLKFSENIQNFTISINYYLNTIHREYENITWDLIINLQIYLDVDDFKSFFNIYQFDHNCLLIRIFRHKRVKKKSQRSMSA